MTKSSEQKFDKDAYSPFFFYKDNSTNYQVWYENQKSLKLKVDIARNLGLAGVGLWTVNFLDYNNSEQIQDMWKIFE